MDWIKLMTTPLTLGRKAADTSSPAPTVTVASAPTSTYLPAVGPTGRQPVSVASNLASSSWALTALMKKARSAASVPLILERKNRKGNWERDDSHELSRILSQPNPHQSAQDIIERAVMMLEITGNAVIQRIRDGQGRTLELWVLDSRHVQAQVGRGASWITNYRVTQSGRAVNLPPETVSHVMYQSPTNPHWGVSPLSSAALAVDTDLEAQRWNATLIRKGAKPSGVVLLDQDLTEDQQAAAMDSFGAQIGGASGAGQFVVLGSVRGVESFGWKPADLDFLDARKFNRDEICAVLGVPSILVSQGQDATYANMETAKKSFWEDTIVPLLSDLVGTLGSDLLRDHGLDHSRWRVRADLSDVAALRENESTRIRNIQAQATAASMLLRTAAFTPESVAEATGLPLITVQQEQAVKALHGLSPPAREHLERKHGVVLADLTPAEALALARAEKEGL